MTDNAPADSQHTRRTARDRGFPKPIGPRRYATQRSGRPVLVCAGDSITHGAMTPNWVTRVADTMAPTMDTVNAGFTGDLAWNLLSRLDDIIACRPTAVTLLIGTNDALAQISRSWSDGYMKAQHLPQRLTAQWYEENVRQIIHRLQSETTAAIALMSLPPLGDTTKGRWHDYVAPYNAIVQAVATQAGVEVLPVHDRIADLITDEPQKPWDGTKKLMGAALARHFLLRRPWDAVARRHGFATTTDGVHLSTTAAARIAALVEQFATTVMETGQPGSL
ncbi:SGNH/GDSL hydrolase family protein [Streptomyces mirabilis]